VRRVVTIEERADIIRQALRRAPDVVLQDLLRDSRDRVIIAVTFLAMLEMTKTREVIIEQHEPWGPIHCRRWAPTIDPEEEPVP
jgi:chromatin segregation and condensation protein Rec8/ScpA/Scc1 (kleisin family)